MISSRSGLPKSCFTRFRRFRKDFATCWFAGFMFHNASGVSKHNFEAFRLAEIMFRTFPVFQKIIPWRFALHHQPENQTGVDLNASSAFPLSTQVLILLCLQCSAELWRCWPRERYVFVVMHILHSMCVCVCMCWIVFFLWFCWLHIWNAVCTICLRKFAKDIHMCMLMCTKLLQHFKCLHAIAGRTKLALYVIWAQYLVSLMHIWHVWKCFHMCVAPVLHAWSRHLCALCCGPIIGAVFVVWRLLQATRTP